MAGLQPMIEIPESVGLPIYEPAEVGRLLGLTQSRVRRWLFGYRYKVGAKSKRQFPVVRRGADASRYASFLDLIDLVGAKAFLDAGASLQKVRRAFDQAAKILGADHPFARRRFFTSGGRIYLELHRGANEAGVLLELLSGQLALADVIRQCGRQIEFDARTELPLKWWPLGKEQPVVVDPAVSFGAPVVAGKGIKTSNVYDFFVAEGQKLDRAARWLHLESGEVEAAVRFERRRLAA